MPHDEWGVVAHEVIAEADRELTLMTYSARPHVGIRSALASAVERGVMVTVVEETLASSFTRTARASSASSDSTVNGRSAAAAPAEEPDRRSSGNDCAASASSSRRAARTSR
ncbi:hypothetical protein [Saccharomonospora xinjiangensis]|uniref:Uncharacterized protein n=1 Tax=Saccharomonospora xinjiangensis XJ-54 TaxID=882086 RepID=I0V229_9PSEU|nr:hypothetical protein [Saccharomonospora xinjiangensis]EID54182.1 hypothetical protein SacxiDRAFT_1945 [Saccharomonospora xinjiangensis XJ-54]